MSFQLCTKCKGLWTYFGSGNKPEVCPKCMKEEKRKTDEPYYLALPKNQAFS